MTDGVDDRLSGKGTGLLRGRKYILVTGLSWLTMALLLAVFLTEGRRMSDFEAERTERLIARGTEIYANNCVVCHGPAGEGVVGPPLNRPAFRGHPDEERETYSLIYEAIARGRPGTTDPNWHRLQTGQWASYTAMPAWSVETGGSLNEQHIQALAYFIMLGDWGQVDRHIPDPNVPSDERGRMITAQTIEALPFGDERLIAEAVSRQGREIFVERACIACHSIGGVGGAVGPDLSKIGSWAANLDRESWSAFLKEWISDPLSVENRAPVYWSNYGGPLQFPFEPAAQREAGGAGSAAGPQESMAGGAAPGLEIPQGLPLPPTRMPALPLSEEELDILVEYLTSLI